jgi:LDH2 family malate/lactate/ureidoglycolate dehydrogenase
MPGVKQIYLPGEIEQENRRRREADGIFIEDSTWNELTKTADALNVAQPAV